MHTQTLQVTLRCLLQGLEEMGRRGGGQGDWGQLRKLGPQWAPVLDGLQEPLPQNRVTDLAHLARRLSTAGHETEGAGGTVDPLTPLATVFTHMGGEHSGYLRPRRGAENQMPQLETKRIPLQPEDYQCAWEGLQMSLAELQPEESSVIPALLTALERWTSDFPDEVRAGSETDLSLYDRRRTAAAFGSCLSEYLLDREDSTFQEAALRKEKTFLLYTAVFSGIQKFIYTVSTDGALKSLRSRSFFLELLMEHYVDELLAACQLSRVNLLFHGGGQCHLLLPKTEAVEEALAVWNRKFNNWLIQEFGISLYMDHGWVACSGNDLVNEPAAESPYEKVFCNLNQKVERRKLRRYVAGQLLTLNREKLDTQGRECKVCGRMDRLVDLAGQNEPPDLRCPWCKRFLEMSKQLVERDVYVVYRALEEKEKTNLPAIDEKTVKLPLPAADGRVYLCLEPEETACAHLEGERAVVRIYSKKFLPKLPGSIRLDMGDYVYRKHAAQKDWPTMEELAACSSGIQRIAVCRMDVDNLGAAFHSGFQQEGETDPVKRQRFVNLPRSAALSRQMTLFFRRYINGILSQAYNEKYTSMAVAIVYAGGDDVFLVGAWNQVLEAACRIREAFQCFTCGALTISCGFTLFDSHFPIRLAASQTAELEEKAKGRRGAKEHEEKDAIALFTPEENHVYQWDAFREQVQNGKLKALQTFFLEYPERGNAFLHHMMELLRPVEDGGNRPIELARYAYLLSKLQPSWHSSQYPTYREFIEQAYGWALSGEDRRQLISASYLYLYENRKGKTDGVTQ